MHSCYVLYALFSQIKITANHVRRLKQIAARTGLCPTGSNQKASNLDKKRAEAQDPARKDIMFRRFAAMALELFTQGKIPAPYWGNDCLYGGDEIGFDPKGHFAPVFAFEGPSRMHKRLFTICDGERAQF